MPAGTDFLISYHPADTTWAEWIASTLEEGGSSTSLKGRGLREGEDRSDRLFMTRIRRLAYFESLEGAPGRFLSVFRHGQKPGEIPTRDGSYEHRPENVEEDLAHLSRLGMRYSIAGIVLSAVEGNEPGELPALLSHARGAIQHYAEQNPPVIISIMRVRDLVDRATTLADELRNVGLRILNDGFAFRTIRYPGMNSLTRLGFLLDEAGEVDRAAKRYAVLSLLERIRWDRQLPEPTREFDLAGMAETRSLSSRDAAPLAQYLEHQAIDRAMEAVTRTFIERLGDFKRRLEAFAATQRSSVVERVLSAVGEEGSREVPGLLEQAEQAMRRQAQENHPATGFAVRVVDLVSRATAWVDEFRSAGMHVLKNGYESGATPYPGMDSLIDLQFLDGESGDEALLSILQRARWDIQPRQQTEGFELFRQETERLRSSDALALSEDLERQAINRAMEAVTQVFIELMGDFKRSLERFAAARSADHTILVLSPAYIESAFLETELAAASSAGTTGRLLPVRVADCELPDILSQIPWIDLVGLSEEDARAELLAGARRIGPPRPFRCMAPPRESFVHREEYENVVAALCAEKDRGPAATAGLTITLLGAGGFGKTAIAVEICYDERVRQRYSDGILWITLGEDIDVAGRLARLRDLIRWWTEEHPPAFETLSAASTYLRRELTGKRVLLVVDDAWNPEDVSPFQGLGPNAALLVTTRDSRVLPAESVAVRVDAMDATEAVRLLGSGLPDEAADLQILAARLGAWPLLLQIVNRHLRELIQQDNLSLVQSVWEVNEALDAEGLTAFDREDLEVRHQAVARTVGVSLRRLSREEVERFEQLATFPEDTDIPLRVLDKFWGLDSFATRRLCGRLHDLSLLLRFNHTAGTIRLHDVIHAYLRKKVESHLPAWHHRLLDTYRPASDRWPDLPRDETYLWHHLFHHLIGAGQSDVCPDLLRDFQYLRSKLEATEIDALLADYSLFVDDDTELLFVWDALRLSAYVLIRDPRQLAGQLVGRLGGRDEVSIQRLLDAARRSITTAWLCPRPGTLTGPGEELIRALDEGSGRIRAIAAVDGRRAVSGSDDGTLRVWDLETGLLKTFKDA